MISRETAFKLLLAMVGLAHLALGLTANLAPPEALAKVVAEFYGATLEVTGQTHHVIRIVGAFMIGVSVMAFLACRDPLRNEAIIFGIITILGLRVLQRIVFAGEIRSAFEIHTMRIWLQVALFLITAIALFVLRPRRTVGPDK